MLRPPKTTTGPRQRRSPVAYHLLPLTFHHSPITGPTSSQALACAATPKQRLAAGHLQPPDVRLRRIPGLPQACPGPAQLSKTQVRKAPEACPGLGCLGCLVQGWPGLDRIPHPPLRFTPAAAGPRGVKAAEPLRISPRDLANKNQAWPGLVQAGLGWFCNFVLTVLNC